MKVLRKINGKPHSSVGGIALRKDGDFGRCAECGKMVALQFSMIRMWSEVLRHWMMWRGCTYKE